MLSLPIELYSSKNSKQIFQTKDGRRFIAKSDAALKNEKTILRVLMLYRQRWQEMIKDKPYPLRVSLKIYRKTDARFDYVNIVQLLFDCMQKAYWLPDDDAKHLIPVFEPYEVDKFNPRVEIEVL